jgi:two-component system phosphorelay protein LuxU
MGDVKLLEQDKIMALREQVGSGTLPIILNIFKQELEEYIQQLTEASSTNNHDTFGRICHAIKGSAPSFGALLLAEQASQLDALYKQQALSEFDTKSVELVPLIRATLDKLEKFESQLNKD